LFNAQKDQIAVVIHPQSIVHSMVEYVDGSVLAQLGQPDMRTPIAYALAYPERIVAGVDPLDLTRAGRLDFSAPDLSRFPCLRVAWDALACGGTTPAVLNAANEVAVAAFLERKIRFTAIARLIEDVLSEARTGAAASLEQVLAADEEGRRLANTWIARHAPPARHDSGYSRRAG
jgi:1-deoxy-D-xylulose-5-phosphate reductoisomerase